MVNLTIDREPRDETNKFSLCVTARSGEPDNLEFRIDIWSLKDEGNFHLRLDGLGYREHFEARTVSDLYNILAHVSCETKYSEPARQAALSELAPLLGQ
jgi:hypothetical protein